MIEFRPNFTVTDHALLRWLERVHGIDIPGFRKLLEAEVETSIYRYDEKVSADGFTFVMDGDRIVTVLEPGWRGKRAKGFSGFYVPRIAEGTNV